MELHIYPETDSDWIRQLQDNLRPGKQHSQSPENLTALAYPGGVGFVAGQYHNLSPENLSVSYVSSHLSQPVTFKTLADMDDSVFVFQFNLSQHTNYFCHPGCSEPVGCKNGIKSCLVSSGAMETEFRQQSGETFEYLQVCVSRSYLKELLKTLGLLQIGGRENAVLQGDLAQVLDIFMAEKKMLDAIIYVLRIPYTTLQVTRLVLTYNVRRLLGAMLKKLVVYHQQQKPPVNWAALRNVEWIKKLVMKNPDYRCSLSEAATLSNMSVSKFKRQFKNNTGLGFIEYCQKLRMEEYMKRLSRGYSYSVTDVAFDAGYNSLAQFSKAFKAFYGEPPSLFQRRTAE